MKTLIALLLLSSSALAADFSAIILDMDNEPILECTDAARDKPECKDKRPLTLGIVAARALLMPEQNIKSEDSLKRGQLALNIYKASKLELTAEEIALIKQQIAKNFGPLVTARTFPMLDPGVK